MSNDSSNDNEPKNVSDKLAAATAERRGFWHPLPAVLLGAAIFVGAQIAASLPLLVYPMLKHWTDAQINDWLGRVYPQFLYVLLAEGLTIAAVWWVMRLRGLKLADIGWKRFRPIMLLYALCGFAVYFVAYLVLLAISSALAPSINLNQQQDIGFQQVSGPVQLLVTFISLAVLPPLAEEFLFRGFLFSNFRKYMKLPAAIILTSLLFAAPHLLESAQPGSLLWVAGIDTFTLSVVLCYLREKTGNLWPGILLHALKNSIAFVSIFIFHLS